MNYICSGTTKFLKTLFTKLFALFIILFRNIGVKSTGNESLKQRDNVIFLILISCNSYKFINYDYASNIRN